MQIYEQDSDGGKQKVRTDGKQNVRTDGKQNVRTDGKQNVRTDGKQNIGFIKIQQYNNNKL